MRTRAGDWALVPAAALAAAATLIIVTALTAEVAAVPTAEPQTRSSTWTPFTAISALFFGGDAFHGDFAVLSIGFGLAMIVLGSLLLAPPGAALLVYALGWEPHPLAAALFGAAWGLAAEIAVFNLLLNWLQADNGIYRALPSWGWWLGMGAWGAALGLTIAALGPLRSRQVPARLGAPA